MSCVRSRETNRIVARGSPRRIARRRRPVRNGADITAATSPPGIDGDRRVPQVPAFTRGAIPASVEITFRRRYQ